MARRFPFIFKDATQRGTRSTKHVTLLLSPIEDSFWRAHQRLKLRPLNGLVRQYSVSHGAGQYRLDFALPRQQIGIELDGHRTHSSPAAIASDRKRQRYLESQGWYIIRFGGQEVFADVHECVKEAAFLASLHGRRK